MPDEFKLVPLPLIFWKSPIRDFVDEDIENMGVSLRVHGQIEPVVCKPPNTEGLYEGVCGRLRYEGAKHAHIPEVLVRIHKFKGEDEVLEWQLVENLHRKKLTTLQRGEGYEQLYVLRRKELGGVKDKSIVKGIAESVERQTGEKKAEQTIRQYIQAAKELPEKVKDKIMTSHNFGIRHAVQLLRLKDKPKAQLELAEKFVQKPMTVQNLKQEVNKILNPPIEPGQLPEGLFNVIYADPPWKYRVKHLRGSPEKHYQTMTVQKICDLKIPATDDAVLFLWATNPMLEDALKVMSAWGFKYKTNMAWVKNRFGVGFYFRGQHELLLVGVKGDIHPPEESNRFPSVLQAPVRRHSEKPEEVYGIIEKMYPNAKYLELFARKKRKQWEAWGNQVEV